MSSSQSDSKRLKILALDGGGVKGLSSLVILQAIWKKYEFLLRRENIKDPPLNPCEVFDLIGGTSTGGLTALMLGRLRMSIDECIAVYPRISEEIFERRQIFGNHAHLYSHSKFETTIKKLVHDYSGILNETPFSKKEIVGNPNAPLLDPRGQECCRTVVLALPDVNLNARPERFRSYTSSHQDRKIAIWEAARATTAAITFFKSMQFEDGTKWSDPGIGFNNPSMELRQEAGEIWGDTRGRGLDVNSDYFLFLNLGTGVPTSRGRNEGDLKSFLGYIRVPVEALEIMYKRALDSQNTANQMSADFDPRIYYRFNADRGLERTKLFDYEKLPEIQQHTEIYLTSVNDRLVDCAERLTEWHMLRLAMRPSNAAEEESKVVRYALSYERVFEKDFSQADRLIFQRLGTGSDYLKVPAEPTHHWDRMTTRAMLEYARIYDQIPKAGKGFVRVCGLLPFIATSNAQQSDKSSKWSRPNVATICKIWKTVASTDQRPGEIDDLLPKNMVMTVLYLLHSSKVFNAKELPKIWSATRIKANKAFGDWVDCQCASGLLSMPCPLKWNFANSEKGLHRGDPLDNCLVLKRTTNRAALKTQSSSLYEQAKRAHQGMIMMWAQGQFSKGTNLNEALSFQRAADSGIL